MCDRWIIIECPNYLGWVQPPPIQCVLSNLTLVTILVHHGSAIPSVLLFIFQCHWHVFVDHIHQSSFPQCRAYTSLERWITPLQNSMFSLCSILILSNLHLQNPYQTSLVLEISLQLFQCSFTSEEPKEREASFYIFLLHTTSTSHLCFFFCNAVALTTTVVYLFV